MDICHRLIVIFSHNSHGCNRGLYQIFIFYSFLLSLQIQFTRFAQQPTTAGAQPQDSLTFVVPILYTTDMNVTQMMIDQKSSVSLSPTALAVNNLLKRFHEINAKQTDCSIFPAIRELLTNLIV